MAMNYVPTNSVEFETLTTEPAYGDVKEFDTDVKSPDDAWKALGFLTRDLRMGNITHRHDDVEWLDDRASLVAAILTQRGGAFKDCAVLAHAPVAATIELSQSREGFFRKNARTFRTVGEHTDKSGKAGLFDRMAGKKQGR